MAVVQTGTTPGQRKAIELKSQMAEAVAAVRANRNLSDEGKQQRIAHLWHDTATEVRDLQQREEQSSAADKQKLERDLFGIPGNATASDAISYRDAQDRVADLGAADPNSHRRAAELMHQAVMSGDTHLAKAVLRRAVQSGWYDVADTYAQAYPAQASKLEALVAASDSFSSSSSLANLFGEVMSYEVVKPAEIGRLSDSTIARLAAS